MTTFGFSSVTQQTNNNNAKEERPYATQRLS